MTSALAADNGLLTVPEGTRTLPDEAFAGREDIVRAVLPASVERFGEEVFSGCVNLREVALPAGLRELGPAAFVNCAALETAELPPGLESVGDGAFLYCAALRKLTLPETLRRIGAMAFWGSGLEEVSVPAAVEEIGESAFWDCAALRRADVLGGGARIGENAFGSCWSLTEGYMAPGYPERADAPAELLFTLLWCSCPERHGAATAARAERFIRANEALVWERVLKYDNTAAMTGLARRRLLRPENIPGYVRAAAEAGRTELTALLLDAGGASGNEEEFAL